MIIGEHIKMSATYPELLKDAVKTANEIAQWAGFELDQRRKGSHFNSINDISTGANKLKRLAKRMTELVDQLNES